MDLGVVSLSLGCLDFDDLLEFVKAIDGSAIELSTADGVHNKTVDFSAEGRRVVVDKVKAQGLRIVSVGGYSDFTISDPEAVQGKLERLRWYCQLALDLGAGILRVMAGNPRPGLSETEMIDNIIAGFKAAVEVAEEYGVIFALENHGTLINDLDVMLKIVESVGSPYFRVTLDTGNYCWAGKSLEEAYVFFEKMAPYTANVHLKDFVVQLDRSVKFVPLGDGELDLKRVLDILRGVGYQGTLLCEYEGVGEPKELIAAGTFDEYVAELKAGTKRSLDYMRSLLNS